MSGITGDNNKNFPFLVGRNKEVNELYWWRSYRNC